MRLSIIIPVYNERGTVLQLLKRVKEVKLKKIKKEIIIVDDYSTDGTRELLKGINDKGIKVIYHKKNFGKGTAVRSGLDFATGDIIMIQDADLEYNPEEYPLLLKPIVEGRTKVVYGSRFLRRRPEGYYIYYLGNRLLTFITNLLYGNSITDMETCYKVFTRDVTKNLRLRAKRFDLEPEITAKILKKGYRITEVPITYTSRKIEEGKKIDWRDGLMAIYYLFKYRFTD